jgi:hypothetical protein
VGLKPRAGSTPAFGTKQQPMIVETIENTGFEIMGFLFLISGFILIVNFFSKMSFPLFLLLKTVF